MCELAYKLLALFFLQMRTALTTTANKTTAATMIPMVAGVPIPLLESFASLELLLSLLLCVVPDAPLFVVPVFRFVVVPGFWLVPDGF